MISMVEHPAWQPHQGGHARLLRSSDGLWLATTGADGITLECVSGTEDHKPAVILTDPVDLPAATPTPLRNALTRRGAVQRVANPWLWDAITTAILRQVVRAAQARSLYQRWTTAYGRSLETPAGRLSLVPDANVLLTLGEAQFSSVGAAFHRTALKHAASAYLANGADWAELPAAELVDVLDAIPRIGPWTAKAAAADYTGDYSIYPHGDLAVRTWAKSATPELEWPAKDRPFEQAWTKQATSAIELHTLTQLTLALGSHDLLPAPDRPDRP
jgi:DNA-3-methyladenine glycosylase II